MFEEEYIVETLNAEEMKLEDKNNLRHFLDCLMMFGMSQKIEEIINTVKE